MQLHIVPPIMSVLKTVKVRAKIGYSIKFCMSCVITMGTFPCGSIRTQVVACAAHGLESTPVTYHLQPPPWHSGSELAWNARGCLSFFPFLGARSICSLCFSYMYIMLAGPKGLYCMVNDNVQRKKRKKDNLLHSRQAHYHCAKGEAASGM